MILISLFFGLVIRIYFAFYQGIYVDEAAWLPSSITYFHAFFDIPQNTTILGENILTPIFFIIVFGILGFVFSGFKLPSVTHYTYLNYVPLNYLIDERLGLIVINFIIVCLITLWIYKKNAFASFVFLVFYWASPMILMDTALLLPTAIVLPFTLLFYIVIVKSKLELSKYGILSAVIFGIMMSSQYYEIIFIVLPIIYYLISFKEIKFRKFIKFFLAFLAISILTFFLLNPQYWYNPVSYLELVLRNTVFVSSTSSGVGGIPSYWLGKVTFNVPVYSVIVGLILSTPIIDLILFVFAFAFSIHMTYKMLTEHGGKIDDLDRLILISLFSFIIIQVFSMSFPLFHNAYFLSLIPMSFVVTIIGKKIYAYFEENHKGNKRMWKISRNNHLLSLKLEKNAKILSVILIIIILLAGLVPTILAANDILVYTNEIGNIEGYNSGRMDGAWNSVQSDMYVGKFIADHNFQNRTILTLALTSMVVYYAPSNHYIQIWGKINGTTLLKYFSGDLIVVDEWYAQLWGNPIYNESSDFNVIYSSYINGGYSILAVIK